MISLFWTSPTAKKQHGSPSNATNPQQHGGTSRIPMRDIEAAVSLGSTQQPPTAPNNRNYPQHDINDPLHRRSSVSVATSNHSNSNVETTEASAAISPTDALSSSIRSGNFTTADLLESKATTMKAIRGQIVVSEPKLLHPYVLRRKVYFALLSSMILV
jgi:hypothetical protein